MSELEAFKTEINLTEYAASEGYGIDRRESSRNSIVMRRASDNDKIIVTRGQDGHWIYFSVRDDTDNGSIIDFVQKHRALSFGYIRQELRPWVGKGGENRPAVLPGSFAPSVETTSKDREAVIRAYHGMSPLSRHPYLEEERAIPRELFTSKRFKGRVLVDSRNNAVFPHFDRNGVCGYEFKNRNFTGFSKHGAKGLWFSAARKVDRCLVIAESGIDAMSYAALNPREDTRYASIGGEMNPTQPELIRGAVAKLPQEAEFVIATDADTSGRRLADQIRDFAEAVARPDITVTRAEPPEEGADWNDQLRTLTGVQKSLSFSHRPKVRRAGAKEALRP